MPPFQQLQAWGTFATSDDHLISRLMERGVGDIHTHLEGCESIPLLWRDFICGARQLHHFPAYGESRVEERSDHGGARSTMKQDRDIVENACNAWKRLSYAGRIRWDQMSTPSDILDPLPSAEALWAERVCLIWAWNRLLATHGGEARDATPSLARDLDAYLAGKQTFYRDHIQHPGSNPGLQNFRRYLDRGRPSGPEWTDRYEWKRRLRLVHTACESPPLRFVELRISPLPTVADYVRYFRRWEEFVRKDPFIKRRGIRIGIIIHFKSAPTSAAGRIRATSRWTGSAAGSTGRQPSSTAFVGTIRTKRKRSLASMSLIWSGTTRSRCSVPTSACSAARRASTRPHCRRLICSAGVIYMWKMRIARRRVRQRWA